jgi:hypothetical protein
MSLTCPSSGGCILGSPRKREELSILIESSPSSNVGVVVVVVIVVDVVVVVVVRVVRVVEEVEFLPPSQRMNEWMDGFECVEEESNDVITTMALSSSCCSYNTNRNKE